MTDNLQNKFGGLETQLTNQHTELMAALTATNNKLDAIAAALGAPPPTATVTLADVLNALNGIHADTTSQDLKLLNIREAIAPTAEAAPPAGKSGLQWLVYRLVDAINPTWPRPVSAPVQFALNALYQELSPMTASWWEQHLGIPQSGSDNVLDWLALIAGYQRQLLPPVAPTPGVGGACAAPAVTDGIAFINSGRNFARWSNPLPSGVTFTTTLGLPARVEISPEATWEGFSIYVYSKKSLFYSEAPNRTTQFRTNEWRTLETLNYPIAVSVDEGDDCIAYLCSSVVSWSKVFNFAIDQQGWQAVVPVDGVARATYVSGSGWSKIDIGGGQPGAEMRIYYPGVTLPAGTVATITYSVANDTHCMFALDDSLHITLAPSGTGATYPALLTSGPARLDCDHQGDFSGILIKAISLMGNGPDPFAA